jgi:hypothetical protein
MTLNGNDYTALVQELNWSDLRVTSFIPGRVRLKSEQLRDDEPLGTRIADALHEVDVITDVAVNPRTGSVLLHYDHSELDDLPTLIDRAASVGMLPDGIEPDELKSLLDAQANGTPRQDVSGEVRKVFNAMDTSVKRATGGTIDLKGLVPLSLVGMGTYRVLSGAATQPLPWFNYFWFAFSIFMAMDAGTDVAPANGEAPETAPPPRSDRQPAAAGA